MKKEKSRTETAMEPKMEAMPLEQQKQPELRKMARAEAKVEAMKHKSQEPEREASKEAVTAGSSATDEENSCRTSMSLP